MSKIHLQIITPQKPVLDKQVDFVVLPASKGELGILPGHTQYITTLKIGVLRYKIGDETETFALLGGIAEIEHNNVSVFAEGAVLQDEIDEETARQQLERAKADRLKNDKAINLEQADQEIKEALLLLKVKKLQSGKLKNKKK
ncbi:MAG: ATP synthase F1 subunit epsilon [Elusimicrobiaceae bacterium]|nr:ATP synthase F1 subunit epsilon [Elusimicrobiaceae bacterium]